MTREQAVPSPLARFRAAAALTQEDLALRSGIGVRQIRNLEAGVVERPRPHTLAALAEALELSAEQRSALLTHHQGWSVTAPAVERPAVPRQLPPAADVFVGRRSECVGLMESLPASPAPVVVCGLSGIGKTTLAVQVGRRCAAQFPDGELYARLTSPDGAPETPAEVVAAFLRALGVDPKAIPDALAERVALWRSMCADRSLFVLLDDAVTEAQVRDLLPGGSSRVVVTSRTALPGLDATRIRLGPLDVECGRELLSAAIADRVREPDDEVALDDLVTACAGHPLALRLIAARVSMSPGTSLRTTVERFDLAGHRLAALASGDRAVRDSIGTSLSVLSERARSIIVAIVHLAAGTFADWQAAAVADTTVAEAGALLDELAMAGVLEAAASRTRRPRYAVHDLVADHLRAAPGIADDVIERLACWAAHHAAAIATVDVPRPVPHVLWPAEHPQASSTAASTATEVDARAWFEDEWQGLARIVTVAAARGLRRSAGGLLAALRPLLTRSGRLDTLVSLAQMCAETAGDDALVRACALLGVASARAELGDHREAAALLERALPDLDEADACTRGGAWYERAWVLQHLGDTAAARESYHRAIALHTSIGNVHGALGCHLALAESFAAEGRRGADFEAQLSEAQRLAAGVDDYRTRVKVLLALTELRARAEPRADIAAMLDEGVLLAEMHDDRTLLIAALRAVASHERTAGRFAAAATAAGRAYELAKALARPLDQAQALTELGFAREAVGLPTGAASAWREALAIRRALHHESQARELEGLLRRVTGPPGPANTPEVTMPEGSAGVRTG